jgi:hypothetical protein
VDLMEKIPDAGDGERKKNERFVTLATLKGMT